MDNKTKNNFPPLVFGTSGLGNLYRETPYELKKEIVGNCCSVSVGPTFFDSAGKYGAGLALSELGKCLEELGIGHDEVMISNKLGWYQVQLERDEPSFEQGVWFGLKHDAIQQISYEGILACYRQGEALLGKYHSDFVSVHDPDEYLAAAEDEADREVRYQDILGAYRALLELKNSGEVKAVGVGAKDWRVIERLCRDVKLDWVMFANSLTIHDHPTELIVLIAELASSGVIVINSAIFNGGFLTGGDFYNYKMIDPDTLSGRELLGWRDRFFSLCEKYNIQPAEACYAFSGAFAGVSSMAMSTSRPEKVSVNANLINVEIPREFWDEMYNKGLIKIKFNDKGNIL